MTPALDEKLCKKYPKLFAQRNKSMGETCMGRGFECGDGWFKLLDTLSYFLEKDGSVEATQVKEKFGTLRFYYSGGNDNTDELIRMFERKSAHVCEACGGWSKLRHVGLIYNMCDKCWDKFKGHRKKPSKIILAKLEKENIRVKGWSARKTILTRKEKMIEAQIDEYVPVGKKDLKAMRLQLLRAV